LFTQQYFPVMDVEQYAWATEELINSAKESVHDLEENFDREGQLVLSFIPLADFESSGAYRIGPETLGFIVYANGGIEWHFPAEDPAFANFEREARDACSSLHDYLVRILTYALAHGMDVAKADPAGNGRSILHAFPHSELHTDAGGYDS
jgi:hypothetical protein